MVTSSLRLIQDIYKMDIMVFYVTFIDISY